MAEVTITEKIHARDVLHVARNMRAADALEVFVMSGCSPAAGLINSIEMTDRPYLALADGEPAAFMGVVSRTLGNTGTPWLLGTDLIGAHKKTFMRMARRFVAHALTQHRTLSNYVHADHTQSVLFLKALGFEMGPVLWTPAGHPVHNFKMER